MAQRRTKRAARNNAWSLHFSPMSDEVRQLSPSARRGLRYAQAIARNAKQRSQMALSDQLFLPAPLTVNELADQDELSPIVINTLIKQARVELFGKDLSRSA